MRILLTGVNGFIGQNLAARALAAGHAVVGVDVGPPAAGHGWVHHESDVRDSAALARLLREESITDVVHGGGVSGPHVANDDPLLITDINITGTVGLFEAVRRVGLPGRVVLLSSSSTYGQAWEERSRTRACEEADVLLAAEPYGASKVAGEAMMRAYIADFGLDAVALRMSIVYGAGRTTYCGMTEMIRQARDSGLIRLHLQADQPLPWVHVSDVCTAIDAALAAPKGTLANGGVYAYNVTGPGRPTFGEIAEAVVTEVPGTTVTTGDEPDAYDMNARAMSIEAARVDLGWVPQVTVQDGVRELVRSLA